MKKKSIKEIIADIIYFIQLTDEVWENEEV